ncbi:hypothetical protein Ancab_040157 [Ancistrocladus abbreviatus]
MEGYVATQPSQDGTSRGRGKNKRYWTPQEDNVLIQALHELATNSKWKSENGFKSGYMNRLEEMILSRLPQCGLRAEPHIESRLKHWSEKYSAMAEMLGTSEFGWDDEKKLLQVEKSVYDEWIKTHKKAKGLYGVSFLYFDILAEIYGKDRATGEISESFVQAINNIDVEIENEPMTFDSSDDDVGGESVSMSRSRTQSVQDDDISSQHPSKKAKKLKTSREKEKRKMDNNIDLATSLHSVFLNFGNIFHNININLATMANTWSLVEEREQCAEKRKQQLNDKENKVLKEVMKLDGISLFEALEVATVLIAEKHKLSVLSSSS